MVTQGKGATPPCWCTCRLTFWIVAALGWVPWSFFIAASADDNWVEEDEFGIVDDAVKDWCSANDFVPEVEKVCKLCKYTPFCTGCMQRSMIQARTSTSPPVR